MACVGAERACVDVDALFLSCWEQDDSLTHFVCSTISAPRLAVVSLIRSCKQAAVEVQRVSALPAVALAEEATSADAEPGTVNNPTEAGKADAPHVTATVSFVVEQREEPEEPEEQSSFLNAVAAPENRVASFLVWTVAPSAKVVSWLGVESESEQAQQGVKVGAEASSMSRSESSCSSHSACLIDLVWDSCSSSAHSLCSSSSADSLCSTPTGSVTVVTGVKRGIGRGISSSGKGWSMEVKGSGKAEEVSTFSNQLFGEDEDGGSRQGYKTFGSGNRCYMNQLYMDEAEEEERESLAASGISVGIGRFGARRRISGSSSRAALRRMSSVLLRQF
ncbi:hypothetical protein CLOM_g4818 [Closterium sp. NIES-68]|nr:hypothetical protein CLOM_g4818 [Closterium sp. NIES-68]GJP68986.1 hypothetical protein CLOP_g25619 [Closterium sp. NIES-67]